MPSRSRSRRRGAGAAARLALLLAGTAAGLLVAEVAYRAYRARHPSPISTFVSFDRRSDEFRLYELVDGPQKLDLRPGIDLGFLRTNALGMRDREYSPAKPAGTYRILALGDSVTFGVQVPEADAWTEQLERGLASRRRSGPPVEVLNMGVPGYNTEQSLLRFLKRGKGLGADLVLLEWSANDLDMSPIVMTTPGRVVYMYWGDGTDPPTPYRVLPGVNARLLAASALYRDASLAAFVWLDRRMGTEGQAQDVRARNLAALVTLRDAVAEEGGRLVVALFPDVTDLQRPVDAADREDAIRHCQEAGIPVVDLVPAFRGLDPAEVRLAPGDPVHLSPSGYRLAAEAIAAALDAHGYLPPP
ncbi:SGNH/GDSL hydrolase family protein [Myxococcota bacterium]|nr:SGNH/GDSL hydrolase family protein [Myxococcota bacterium]